MYLKFTVVGLNDKFINCKLLKLISDWFREGRRGRFGGDGFKSYDYEYFLDLDLRRFRNNYINVDIGNASYRKSRVGLSRKLSVINGIELVFN